MKYKELEYSIDGIYIDGCPYDAHFDSIKELEAFLLGFFYGLNKEK